MRWITLFNSFEEAKKRLPDNQVVPLNLGTKALAIARRNEELFIFERNCPHQHASLLEGRFNNFDEIICPLHEFRFNLKGGQEAQGRCRDLNLYPVQISDSVQIGLKD